MLGFHPVIFQYIKIMGMKNPPEKIHESKGNVPFYLDARGRRVEG